MNFEHYKNFVTVVECRNISAAAERLHIAQSALSNELKAFETMLGAQLLIRGPRTLELTDAGQIFYTAAKNMIRVEESAIKEINDCKVGRRGTLKLGLTPALPDHGIESMLLHFSEKNPFVSFEIHEANTSQLFKLLKDGVIEVAVVRTPVYIPPFLNVSSTTKEQFYAIVRDDGTFWGSGETSITVDQLQNLPLSVPHGFQKLIADRCGAYNFEPLFFSISSSRNATLMWAQAGRAVAILSSGGNVDLHQHGMRYLPIRDPELTAQRSIVTLRNGSVSAIAKGFLKEVAPYLENTKCF